MAPRSKAGAGEAESEKGAPLLRALGERVRERRRAAGITLKELSTASGLSERFLVSLEGGKANVSVVRLAEVAEALGTTMAALLSAEGGSSAEISAGVGSARKMPLVALLGLRGAGKTTLGGRAAARLGVPFVELDSLVAARAGMSLSEIFEMQGPAYFRRLEREELLRLVGEERGGIVATSGSLVTDHATFELVQRVAVTVWLSARPEDHFQRVIDQGDARPMASRPDAMAELRAILRARRALYERASHVIDTSALGLSRSIERLVKIVRASSRGRFLPKTAG